ncbi:transposase [Deinococcus detaillensis]|uniref:Transposase n=1 Tax=Deinococcus detaillensis TaxID=2592048 RepID=A0A553UIC4_9DEIO|nr:transposase [Deinococcus detaillensis]
MVIPEHLAIDELYLAGHRAGQRYSGFWTVITDNSDTRRPLGQRVLGLCRGREPAEIRPMLREVLGWYGHKVQAERPRLSSFAMDMWSPFRDAVLEVLPQAPIVFDRFHFQRHLTAAHQAALEWCQEDLEQWQWSAVKSCKGQPCTCGQRRRCQQYQWTQRLHTHLNTLWILDSETAVNRFFRDLENLWETVKDKAWREPYSKVDYLMNIWQEEVWEAALLRSQGHTLRGTGRAERINREIRRLIALYRLMPLERSLERLMSLLHTSPAEHREILAVPPADQLVCPRCGAGGTDVRPAADATPIKVRHLPRGLDRVVLLLPSRIDCPSCGSTQLQPQVARALETWLREPALLALSAAMLHRLTGVPVKQLRRRQQQAPAPQLPLDLIWSEVVVYSELRTATRAWLVLSVPSGAVVDIRCVDIRSPSPHVRVAKGPRELHVRVAEAARELLLQHEPPTGYETIVLTTQTGELKTELWPWLSRNKVVLKPFVARGLVVKFCKQAKNQLKELKINLGKLESDWLKPDAFAAPLTEVQSSDMWREVQRHDPDLARVITELRQMDAALSSKSLSALKQVFEQKSEDDSPGSDLRQQMWAAWWVWKSALLASVTQPLPPLGYEPHLMRRIRSHLQTSPALDAERQRRRLLRILREEALLSKDARVRQEARRKRL